jgi:hypothetical protein
VPGAATSGAHRRQHAPIRHDTAIRRLRTIADRCQQASGLWDDEPFLVGAYVFGAVLEARATVDVVQMAFVLNLSNSPFLLALQEWVLCRRWPRTVLGHLVACHAPVGPFRGSGLVA